MILNEAQCLFFPPSPRQPQSKLYTTYPEATLPEPMGIDPIPGIGKAANANVVPNHRCAVKQLVVFISSSPKFSRKSHPCASPLIRADDGQVGSNPKGSVAYHTAGVVATSRHRRLGWSLADDSAPRRPERRRLLHPTPNSSYFIAATGPCPCTFE